MRLGFASVLLLLSFCMRLGCVIDSYSSALFWVAIMLELFEKGKNEQDNTLQKKNKK